MRTNKIVIVVLALVVIGFGFYYFVSNGKSYSVPAPISNENIPSAAPALNNPAAPATTVSADKSEAPQNVSVIIKNYSFNPQITTIKVGSKVTWTNNDGAPHTVTGGSLNSQTLSPGQSFSYTFNQVGTVTYHCSIHPGMTGEVVVQN